MAKQALAEKTKQASRMHVGVFPLEFDDASDTDDLVSLPSSIHLIPIGAWNHDMYGPIVIDSGDIREFVQNFNQGIRKGVYITAGHEGFEELPAVGWLSKVEARADGLWGDVDWNDLGEEILSDKQYKFFSPEFFRDYEDPQTHAIYRNVLTGGALTKSPYFKELEAVVFSDKRITKQFNENTMDLASILAKDIATLTAEEKAFVKENEAQLTEEQKVTHAELITVEAPVVVEPDVVAPVVVADPATVVEPAPVVVVEPAPAVVEPDVPADVQVQASDKKVMVSASELASMKADALKFREQSMTADVANLMFTESNKAGRFLPKSEKTVRAFMESLNAVQRTAFSVLVAELPDSKMFTELGGAEVTDGTATAEVDAKVNAKISASEKEGKTLEYASALKAVFAENTELATRYSSELPSARRTS